MTITMPPLYRFVEKIGLPRLLFTFAIEERQSLHSWQTITDDQRQGWVNRANALLDAALARGGQTDE